MRVYIGAPIDCSQGSPKEQFELLAEWVLEGRGPHCVIYNPLAAFVNAGVSSVFRDIAFLEKVNRAALSNSDLGVFVWNGFPSFGVPLEIQYLVNENIPVVVLNTTGRPLGAYMRGMAMKKLITIVDTPAELMTWIKEYENKPHLSVLSEDDGEI